jgi:hypothetical protein
MPDNKTRELEKKIKQTLNQLGDLLDSWLSKQRPKLHPVPIPVDRPRRSRRQEYRR